MSYRTKFPNTAITPGPQITSLRSTTPTTPTAVSWASTGYIDLVADCGADPTGVADCGPAFVTAFGFAQALGAAFPAVETAIMIFIPPGVYNLHTTPGLVNMLNFATSLTLRGCGDASVIKLNHLAGTDAFTFANGYELIIEELTFLGTQTGGNPDTGGGVLTVAMNSPEGSATIRDCRFLNILSPSIIHGSGIVYVERCEFSGNSSDAGLFGVDWGTIYGTNFINLHVSDCRFTDISALNGQAISGALVGSQGSFIHVDGGPTFPNLGVRIINCFFDEGCTHHVWVVGGGAGNAWNEVIIENCSDNTPLNASATSGSYRFDTVTNVYMRGIYASDATGHTAVPIIQLVGVQDMRLTGLSILAGSLGNFITADSTSRYVRIVDSPTLLSTNVLSKASVTEITEQVFRGNAAAVGGTFVVNMPVPTNQAVRLNAEVFLSHVSGVPSLDTSGRLAAKCVAENQGGIAAAFVTAIAGSANPVNSNTAAFAATDPQVADAGFVGAGPPTAVWTVAGVNAVLTVTNPGANIATVAVKIDEVLYGLAP